MNVPVEAQSLSALINLLGNPPQYPRNPTHEVRDPLVLYIVRVPGSKDVFLTPLKPPTKASISLEAIQSSLYYLHVATERDEEVKQSLKQERRSEELERLHQPIHRKPLPLVPHANYPPSERPLPPPKSYPHYQAGLDGDVNASQGERYAARGANLRFNHEAANPGQGGRSGPPSPRRFQRSDSATSDEPFKNSTRGSPVDVDGQPPYAQRVSYAAGHGGQDLQYVSSPNNENVTGRALTGHGPRQNSPPYGHNRSSFDPVHPPITITLIRRDPVSGSQWNVGSIHLGYQHSPNAPLDPVSIEITTPGYTRFTTMPQLPRSGTGLSDAGSIKDAIANGILAVDDNPKDSVTRQLFTRVAEYQQQSVDNRTLRLHRRTNSADSFTNPPSPTKQLRSIYSFLSPWQGVCTFSNGIDGRSLKCRHRLASSTFTEEDTTVNVAELRFNLPWSPLPSASEKGTANEKPPISQLIGPRSGKETFKRGFQHVKNIKRDLAKEFRERKSSDDEDSVYKRPVQPGRLETDMDRLSLDLGREKAGGGFKGNSAKLGKLIIEDEGLKMCDLLVAACMGVWWQHYEGKND